jgi:GNAT superfamily N-acetyltransferase
MTASQDTPLAVQTVMEPDPAVEDGSTALLRGGVTVNLRQLSTADFDSVLQIADTLSDRERYFRFFSVHPGYIAEWAESLTKPATGVVAVGAFDHGELVGVANYAPSNQTGHVGEAEIAVLVAHDQHDRGVGTALLGELVRLARRNGEHRLVADVLCENNDMLRLIRDSPIPVTMHRDGSEVTVDVDLEPVSDS